MVLTKQRIIRVTRYCTKKYCIYAHINKQNTQMNIVLWAGLLFFLFSLFLIWFFSLFFVKFCWYRERTLLLYGRYAMSWWWWCITVEILCVLVCMWKRGKQTARQHSQCLESFCLDWTDTVTYTDYSNGLDRFCWRCCNNCI